MRRRVLAAVIVVTAVLGPAPRGESLTCMLVPLIEPRASSRPADQIIAHIRVVDGYPSRARAGVIHARIVGVLAGKTARGMVRIDADWVLRWRMGLPDGATGFPRAASGSSRSRPPRGALGSTTRYLAAGPSSR